MTEGSKWFYLAAGGVAALMLVFGVAFVFINTEAASIGRIEQSSAGIGYTRMSSRAPMLHGMGMGWHGNGDSPLGNYGEALAEALGITVEELQAAYEKAFTAAIEKAMGEGFFTQDQADKILSRDGFGFRGRGGFRGLGGNLNELLAEALGISVAELENAQAQARDTVITEAVEAGTITQEQADLMSAQGAIAGYVEDAMKRAYGEAVKQAVADGVITQAQADQLVENGGMGFRGPGGFFGGRGIFGGRGAFGPDCDGD